MVSVGIDFSMSSPCICVNKDGTFQNSKVYFLTSVKKYHATFGNINGEFHKIYSSPTERFNNIADWALQCITKEIARHEDVKIFIEGYSMGSKGQVFEIGENTGVLKNKLYLHGFDFKIIPPTTLKKAFTSHGGSDKTFMMNEFVKRTGVDLYAQLHATKTAKIGNPFSDIVDSWALSLEV